MKTIVKMTLLTMLVIMSLVSCNKEELFVEDIKEEVVEEDNTDKEEEKEEEEGTSEDNNDEPVDASLPCEFDLNTAAPNSTVIVNCTLDLNGETINLPVGVNLEFEGGEITNGTLNFSEGSIIGGELLNATLTIGGTKPQLKDKTFTFEPKRWGIVEGKTTSDIALENNRILEATMFTAKEFGVTTFKIDKMDAYFEGARVTSTTTNQNFYPHQEAVNIPSDFNLEMTDNTHLRIQPATIQTEQLANGAILSVQDASNVTVKGGHFHGDRDVRYYSPDNNGNEGSHLFYIQSGTNVTLDGLKFYNGSKGGLNISSVGFTYQPNYKPTNNVKILNCLFENNRRMAVSLTDGRNILFEGNSFIDTALPSSHSTGGEVGYAVNIEATRYRDDNGNIVEYEKATDIVFRNNNERGSRVGSISIHIGQNVTVDNNDLEKQVSYTYTNGTKIINNHFVAEKAKEGYAIFATGNGDSVYNNEISGNNIENYSLGIITNTIDVVVKNNRITDCNTGILITKTSNATFSENYINVAQRGISATNTSADNIEILSNEIYSNQFLMYFVQFNNKPEDASNTTLVDNNTFKNFKKVTISNSNGINFSNNNLDGGMEIGNASNISISNNTIKPTDFDGIRLYDSHTNISILNNQINDPTGADRFECIGNKSTSPNEITEEGNSCL